MYDLRRSPALAELAAATQGVVHLDDCRAAGMTEEQVGWLVESGRWQRPFPRVLVSFSGPLPRESQLFAALAYAGAGAALCGQTAGWLWSLGPWSPVVHAVVPYAREVEDQPGLKIHRSRTLTEADVQPGRAPRRTCIERTVADLLRGRRTVESALGLVADAVRSRQTSPAQIRATLEALPKTRWRREVLLALPDVAAGAQSPLELHDARLRRRHGLPKGERQVRRGTNGVEYLDVVIKKYGVHVELDGRLGHDRATEIWRDFRRDNASVVGRMRHLRYGWADMLGRGCAVMVQQAQVLRQQGWPGPFVRCRSCPAELPPDL